MTIAFTKTRYMPDLRRLDRDASFTGGGVLAMRSGPEDISIQLRRAKDFMSVNLTLDEARELGKALLSLVDEVDEPQQAYWAGTRVSTFCAD